MVIVDGYRGGIILIVLFARVGTDINPLRELGDSRKMLI